MGISTGKAKHTQNTNKIENYDFRGENHYDCNKQCGKKAFGEKLMENGALIVSLLGFDELLYDSNLRNLLSFP
jgi:hypothetical protein